MSLPTVLAGVGTSLAAAQGARLTAEQARVELFGVGLAGVNESVGDEWRERIEPSGRTVYERGGRRRQGQIEMRAMAGLIQLCARRELVVLQRSACGQDYRFDDLMRRTVRCGVRACPAVGGAYAQLGAAL